VLGVDPAGSGVLARHRTADLPALLARLDAAVVEERTTVVAELDDGQRLLGLNETFVGDRGHQSARYRLRLPDGRGEAPPATARSRPTNAATRQAPDRAACGPTRCRSWSPTRVHARRPDVLVRLLERSGQTCAAAERDVAVDRTTLTAMLNWYRAMPFGGRDPGLVGAPVLYVWGSADNALLRPTAERIPQWVPGPLTYVELPGANHWLPEQNVVEVAPLLLRHVAAHPALDG